MEPSGEIYIFPDDLRSSGANCTTKWCPFPESEGIKEDKTSWVSFFQWLRGRGMNGVKLIVGDKCQGMLEAVGEVFPEAKYQRRIVHFYRNIFSMVPKSKIKLAAKMLKAIHAQESKKAAREKAKAVVDSFRQ